MAIEIKLLSNKRFVFQNKSKDLVITAENNATLITVAFPDEYESYSKRVDFVTAKQTAWTEGLYIPEHKKYHKHFDKQIFTFTLPNDVTMPGELKMQFVAYLAADPQTVVPFEIIPITIEDGITKFKKSGAANPDLIILSYTQASEALFTAQKALSKAEGALVQTGESDVTAAEAKEIAADARETAGNALSEATAAKSQAGAAKDKADAAERLATETQTVAENAALKSDEAGTVATRALNNSEHAVSLIGGLVDTVESAERTAQRASSDALTTMQNTADALRTSQQAAETAEQAVEIANQAVQTADNIDSKADEAMAASEAAKISAAAAEEKATDAAALIDAADERAAEAVRTAEQALATIGGIDEKADEALATASQADESAKEALRLIAKSDGLSEQVLQRFEEVTEIANEAKVTAEQAEQKSDDAVTTVAAIDAKANSAIYTADRADANASEALTALSEAAEDMNAAKTTADNALEKAEEAIETAESADSKASDALTQSLEADSASYSAKQYAEQALEIAESAKETATLAKAVAEQAVTDITDIFEQGLKPLKEATEEMLENKVDKVSGKGLSAEDYTAAEKIKLDGIAENANNYEHPSTHPPSIITQDEGHRFVTDTEKSVWGNKAEKTTAAISADGLMSAADKAKLDGIAENANNYEHPATHPPEIITQDANSRFVTDAEKAVWNGKAGASNATQSAAGLMSATDKAKLDGIAVGAQVNAVTNVAGKTGAVSLVKADVGLGSVDNTSDVNKPISAATQNALNQKIDKEEGKGLSTNDFTDYYMKSLHGFFGSEDEPYIQYLNYYCTGVNDNIRLTELVQSWMRNSVYGITLKVNIIGTVGISENAILGAGTTDDYYCFFNFANADNFKNIEFDWKDAVLPEFTVTKNYTQFIRTNNYSVHQNLKINFRTTATYTVLLYGANVKYKNLTLTGYTSNNYTYCTNGASCEFSDCNFMFTNAGYSNIYGINTSNGKLENISFNYFAESLSSGGSVYALYATASSYKNCIITAEHNYSNFYGYYPSSNSTLEDCKIIITQNGTSTSTSYGYYGGTNTTYLRCNGDFKATSFENVSRTANCFTQSSLSFTDCIVTMKDLRTMASFSSTGTLNSCKATMTYDCPTNYEQTANYSVSATGFSGNATYNSCEALINIKAYNSATAYYAGVSATGFSSGTFNYCNADITFLTNNITETGASANSVTGYNSVTKSVSSKTRIRGTVNAKRNPSVSITGFSGGTHEYSEADIEINGNIQNISNTSANTMSAVGYTGSITADNAIAKVKILTLASTDTAGGMTKTVYGFYGTNNALVLTSCKALAQATNGGAALTGTAYHFLPTSNSSSYKADITNCFAASGTTSMGINVNFTHQSPVLNIVSNRISIDIPTYIAQNATLGTNQVISGNITNQYVTI